MKSIRRLLHELGRILRSVRNYAGSDCVCGMVGHDSAMVAMAADSETGASMVVEHHPAEAALAMTDCSPDVVDCTAYVVRPKLHRPVQGMLRVQCDCGKKLEFHFLDWQPPPEFRCGHCKWCITADQWRNTMHKAQQQVTARWKQENLQN